MDRSPSRRRDPARSDQGCWDQALRRGSRPAARRLQPGPRGRGRRARPEPACPPGTAARRVARDCERRGQWGRTPAVPRTRLRRCRPDAREVHSPPRPICLRWSSLILPRPLCPWQTRGPSSRPRRTSYASATVSGPPRSSLGKLSCEARVRSESERRRARRRAEREVGGAPPPYVLRERLREEPQRRVSRHGKAELRCVPQVVPSKGDDPNVVRNAVGGTVTLGPRLPDGEVAAVPTGGSQLGRGAQRGREEDHKRLLLSGGAPAHPEPIVLKRAPDPKADRLGGRVSRPTVRMEDLLALARRRSEHAVDEAPASRPPVETADELCTVDVVEDRLGVDGIRARAGGQQASQSVDSFGYPDVIAEVAVFVATLYQRRRSLDHRAMDRCPLPG